MFDLQMIWAYVDPVTVLPVTSIIATVVGMILLCGKGVSRAVARWARLARLQRRGGRSLRGAHFELKRRQPGGRRAATAHGNGTGHE